ncbi:MULTISPECIES: hypothetical protein [unclassified Methylobacterium]|jgi:hypothetical protein|uniref:hypothetical protein n=1 Tax=unclassified Methylobacterium TaxID=2615210 RepID=UPI001114F422|nr:MULTISPECIES: hypothetical protein [unclassified Methylobacterium]
MSARILIATAIVIASAGAAFAQTAAPNAAGTATTTTRQTHETGAGTTGGNAPASSVGGAISGSDAMNRATANEAQGLSPKPSRQAPDRK